METILPWGLAPWTTPVDKWIRIEEREKARQMVQQLSQSCMVYVDGAVREGLCSIGVVGMANTHQPVTLLQETVARAKSFSALAT